MAEGRFQEKIDLKISYAVESPHCEQFIFQSSLDLGDMRATIMWSFSEGSAIYQRNLVKLFHFLSPQSSTVIEFLKSVFS